MWMFFENSEIPVLRKPRGAGQGLIASSPARLLVMLADIRIFAPAPVRRKQVPIVPQQESENGGSETFKSGDRHNKSSRHNTSTSNHGPEQPSSKVLRFELEGTIGKRLFG
jgi:hypothetical protein